MNKVTLVMHGGKEPLTHTLAMDAAQTKALQAMLQLVADFDHSKVAVGGAEDSWRQSDHDHLPNLFCVRHRDGELWLREHGLVSASIERCNDE